MKKLNKYLSILVLTTLIMSPTLTLAKNDKNKTENENVQKEIKLEENHSTIKCFKAWGHLFSFGWLKKNNSFELPAGCYTPFGIGQKLGITKSNATTTPDTKAPIISDITSFTNTNYAIIRWTTDEITNNKIFYSTTTPINTQNSLIKTQNTFAKNNKIFISGLTASTTYYFIIESKDKTGNTSTSTAQNFITK